MWYTSAQPARSMRSPPTPKISISGCLALSAATTPAPCISPDASPAMIMIRNGFDSFV